MKTRLGLLIWALALLGFGAASAGPVDINTADADTLAAELTGVGPSLAAVNTLAEPGDSWRSRPL